MPDERFEEHLLHPVGRGRVPVPDGAAGGAACGDLVRIGVVVQGDRVADAGFEASGCGAAIGAGSAAVELVRGAGVLDAARVGTHAISDALGGLSPGKLHAAELAAEALARALGRAAAADGAAAIDPERTLVAMSGGVDSAVAALRSGPHAATVTLELWRDPDNDAERSCCSASAVGGARAIAHGMGLAHFTLDLRAEFRAGVVDPFLDAYAAGETPNPCVRCNGSVRLDDMLALADRVGAATLATGHYARVARDGDGLLLRVASDLAKDQSYMLCAVDPGTLERLRFPLGALRKPEVRERAAAAGLVVADKPDSQDLCFLAGTAGPTPTRSASAAASGSGARSARSTCCRPTRAPTASSSGAARTCAGPTSACAPRPCTATARGWTGSSCAIAPRRFPGGSPKRPGRAATGAWRSLWTRPSSASRRGRSRA